MSQNRTEKKSMLSIEIGNRCIKVDEKNWEWTVFVRTSEKKKSGAIRSVEYELHPTFRQPVVKTYEYPFEVTRKGWGTFNIGVNVTTQDGVTHNLKHLLSFDAKETYETTNIPMIDKDEDDARRIPTTKYVDPQLKGLIDLMEKSALTKWNGPRMTGVSKAGMHGILGDAKWTAPRRVVTCDEEARPGYNTMKAHEYEEEPDVLRAKVAVLANMLRASKACTAYTGAGISTASGIDDYASKAKGSVAMKRKKVSGFNAMPTLAHRVLGSLYRAGHLKHWVQQNHDGLPQKAGFPPERLNEIHGAWYDPSNPVVPMTGSLRGDLMDWLLEWEKKADLVLAMGTSLCGMNADRVVVTASKKFVKRHQGQGSVIVSLQRTQYDETSSLRIYAKIDEVMAMLAKEMSLHVPAQSMYKPNLDANCVVANDVFRVPYDKQGRLTKDKSKWQNWDLRIGSEVRVTEGPGKGYVGVVVGKRKDGHYRVQLPLQREGHRDNGKVWSVYILGSWWLETATNGRFPLLPVVNTGKLPRPGWDKSAPTSYHAPPREEADDDDE